MKVTHRYNHGWAPSQAPNPIDERYDAELERALRRAEKKWKAAQARHDKVQQDRSQPSSRKVAAERELHARWEELQDLHRLMQQAPGAGGRKHSGRRSVHAALPKVRLP